MTRVDLLNLSRTDLNMSVGFAKTGKCQHFLLLIWTAGRSSDTFASCRGGQMGCYGGLDVLAVADSELSRSGLTQHGLVGAAACTLTVSVTKTNTSGSN